MVSFFQGLGIAAGSFSDVIEEKQKQRDLAAREERIAKRDRAWQVEDFEKRAELVRKKEESERLRKEEEAERASLAWGRVAGIPQNEWNNTPLAQRKQFEELYGSLNTDFTPGEWWNLSYRNGSFNPPSLPKDEKVTKNNLIGQNWLTVFDENATQEERNEARRRIELMETSKPGKPKTLSDVVLPYYKMVNQVNENKEVSAMTGQFVFKPSAQEVLTSDFMGNKFDFDTFNTMKNVFRAFSNEANASSKTIRIAYELGQEQDKAKYMGGKYFFDQEQVEQTLNNQTNISNLIAAVTEVKSFVDSNKQITASQESPLASKFNALAVSNVNNLKAFLPRVYLSGISTINGIGAYVSSDKTYQTFFNGKVVPFKIEKDRDAKSFFFKVNGEYLDRDNPLAKYIMFGPGAN